MLTCDTAFSFDSNVTDEQTFSYRFDHDPSNNFLSFHVIEESRQNLTFEGVPSERLSSILRSFFCQDQMGLKLERTRHRSVTELTYESFVVPMFRVYIASTSRNEHG